MWYELFQKSAAVSQRDINAYRKYTGASNKNSAMDRWKTEQAMKGVRGEGLSNAAYRRAMAAQQQQPQQQPQPETPVVSEAEQTWQPTPAPKAPAVNFKPTTGQAVATALQGNTAPIAAMDPVAAQRNKEQRPQNVAELQQTYKPEMLPDYQTPTMADADRISASILGASGVRSLTNAVPTQAQAQQESMYQNYAANNKEHQNVLGNLREPESALSQTNTPAVTQSDVDAYRKYTGASDLNSAMDRWKTEQAMKGVRGEGLSNAAYSQAMAAQQPQPETPVVGEAEQSWQSTPAPAAAPKDPAELKRRAVAALLNMSRQPVRDAMAGTRRRIVDLGNMSHQSANWLQSQAKRVMPPEGLTASDVADVQRQFNEAHAAQ